MASQNPSSIPLVLPNALPALNNAINNSRPQWLPYLGGSGATVDSIIAGTNITITPTSGVGAVTVNAPSPPSPFVTGMIMPFNGTVAPAGWALCDGSVAGVPNLTGRFIIGGATGSTQPFYVGNTGGAPDVALTLNMLPDHIHNAGAPGSVGDTPGTSSTTYCQGDSATSGIAGGWVGGTAVPTMPPWTALMYIQKL